MKIVYYKSLLTQAKHLKPNERIIYSFLVSKSICQIDSIYDSDGISIMTDELYSLLEDCNYIDLFQISVRKLALLLHLSPTTVLSSLNRLKELHYIQYNTIFVNKELIEKGYIELHKYDILNGEILIFYSYIRYKAMLFGGYIDTFKAKLAEELDTTKIAITKMLNRLYELSLAQRLNNGKLKVI